MTQRRWWVGLSISVLVIGCAQELPLSGRDGGPLPPADGGPPGRDAGGSAPGPDAGPQPKTCSMTAGAPFGGALHPVPGIVEAEDYDLGGEGVGYHDVTPGNAGGAHRTDDVDVKSIEEGHAVGWFQAGEWLAFTVYVERAGRYRIELRTGSVEPGRSLTLEACGETLAAVEVPQVARWGDFATVRVEGVELAVGAQVIRVTMGDLDYADLDRLTIELEEGPPPPPPPPPDGFAGVVAGVRPRGVQCGSYERSAPSGGREYVVAPGGNDASAGTGAAPFRTLSRAADAVQAGDVVTIRAGSYRERVLVRNSGTSAAPIVFQAEECGTVVLTGGSRDHVFAGADGLQHHVTLKGLVFRDYAPFVGDPERCHGTTTAARLSTGWRVEDCLFERAADRAITTYGSHIVVTRTTIVESGGYAILGAGESATDQITDLTFSDLILHDNNATGLLHPACGASVKILHSRRVVVDNVESYGNVGPGFWLDANNFDFVIRNGYFHDNRGFDATWQGPGVWIELWSGGGLVEHNVFHGNEGPGLGLLESQGHTIRDNLFAEDGIELRGLERGDGVPHHVTLTDNFFRRCGTYSSIGELDSAPLPGDIGWVVDRNVYERAEGVDLFRWGSRRAADIPAMRIVFGFESEGSEAAVPWPP